jgi:hypothetical protein
MVIGFRMPALPDCIPATGSTVMRGIGQHVTPRIVSMPVQYRSDYVDTDQIYYGYDNGRVYQIDRKTQLILALLDLDILP